MGLYRNSLLLRKVAKSVLKVFWFVPIKKNRILFQSYENGIGYIDNPMYLCNFIMNKYPKQYELVFSMQKGSYINSEEVGKEIKIVDCKSLKWLYYMSTSQVVVVNVRMPPYLTRRRGQLIINTWHAGGAYKRTGKNSNLPEKVFKYSEEQRRKWINLMISSSEKFTESNICEGMQYQGEILECGMPRNDIFFSEDHVRSASAKVRSLYGGQGAIIVLYAPTFRGLVGDQNKIQSFPPFKDLASVLERRFKRDVVILVRKHHHDSSDYCFESNVHDVSNYPDMQELLCGSDILITDYSSSMWDFALLGRPCFFYVPDLEQYEKEDRGFFTPIEKWPGIICRNNKELITEIENVDHERSKEIAKKHLEYMGSYERGEACRIITNRIINATDQ